ncbi:MAG: DUF4234 domain-containing protein [bacterium]
MNTPIKRRNMLAQVFIFVFTCGIYGIYWFYQTALEMKSEAEDAEASPGLWTVLLFVPFAFFYSHYKYAELFEAASDDDFNMWLLFVLWIVFCPAVWFIVQTELNRQADG